ncbi:hypothetical protein [uncultured Dubosiella sp.]|uniref:hypothetical protein n=1 Tax=uncultured Dubosiella sp. TaxID=1937011 RepID=UPI00272FA219|nr:hypothetical protein [uncultured Dubosiella sp.]
MKPEVTRLIGELKAADFCCRKLIRLNQELEELNHRMLGLSHDRPALTPEQERSDLPMPTYFHGYTSPLAMMEEITKLEQDMLYYRRRLYECKPIELLSMRDQNILFDLYFFRMRQEDVAEKYGYTRRGLIKKINQILNAVI